MPRCFSSSIQSEGAHFAGDLNGAAEPQQLFGQRRFTRVGVGNDGKGTPAGNFSIEGSHGRASKCGKSAIIPLPPAKRRGLRGQSATQVIATVDRKNVQTFQHCAIADCIGDSTVYSAARQGEQCGTNHHFLSV
jgi:hypothetical protein